MLTGGLVSISFRSMEPRAIVTMVAKAGLKGIEWGGDIHVPHGDIRRARDVREMTLDAGLVPCSYGSYYRAGEPAGDNNPEFGTVLDSTNTLEAPVVRVWCGRRASDQADDDYRKRVVDDLEKIGETARERDVVVACEYHANTLTDTNESARKMFREIASDNVIPYWQPPGGMTHAEQTEGLKALLPTLGNLHVFHWEMVDGKRERKPLAQGREHWIEWLQLAARTGRNHWALLEFVRNDSQEQFAQDAQTLKAWLAECAE